MRVDDAPVPNAPAEAPAGAGKAALRLWARSARAGARAERGVALDEAVRSAIRASDLYRRATTVALYLPVNHEVDLEPLLADDKRFVAPRAHALPAPSLTFHLLGAELETRRWGVREPGAQAPRVALHEIDLMLVPGLLFDESGTRLGYGQGYYDRLLQPRSEQQLPVTVGVTFEALVQARLPSAEHDVPVDYLATEAGVRPARRG